MSYSNDDVKELMTQVMQMMGRKDMSYSDFGHLAGVTGTTVSNWISGKSKPTPRTVNRLKGVLNGIKIEKATRKITVKQAAECIGASEQFVRIGLQKGRLPIGSAVMEEKKWAYNISPHLLRQYIGDEDFERYFRD